MKASDQTQLSISGVRTLCNGGLSQPDHTHTCEKCGYEWACEEFTLKECEAKGVINAAKVNKEGPWCLLCLHIEMAQRIGHLRGLLIRVTIQPAGTTPSPVKRK